MIDYILSENQLVGSALVMALSKSLKGTASHWLSQTCFWNGDFGRNRYEFA